MPSKKKLQIRDYNEKWHDVETIEETPDGDLLVISAEQKIKLENTLTAKHDRLRLKV